MQEKWAYAIASVILVSLLSLVGIAFISMSERRLRQIIFVLVSLAIGSLFGDAFIHLIPDSFDGSTSKQAASLYILAGIFAFFILEKFFLWRHQHTLESSDNPIHPVGYMNLIADGIHNFIDGMIIGASYLVSLPIGVASTLAVIFHEIPQEIGDFGILLYAGFSKTKALGYNFLSATLAILGTIVSLLVGSQLKEFTSLILPFAAGGFIYIAGSDLIPELHKEINPSKSLVQFIAMAAGVGLMLILKLLE
ncbi:MAG TPA: ZIP family metal transporter [Blastocatellia bacterium]|jgi:zinc and cadmium transporter|nr:ZIP family metal transporter [Blastocatellia bacterium]